MLSVDFTVLEQQLQKFRMLSSELEQIEELIIRRKCHLERYEETDLLSKQLTNINAGIHHIRDVRDELAFQINNLVRILEIYDDIERELIQMVNMLPEHIFSHTVSAVDIQSNRYKLPVGIGNIILDDLFSENWLRTASMLWRNSYE